MSVRAHVLIARFGDKRRHLVVVGADTREEALSLAGKQLGEEVALEPHGKPLDPAIAASLGLATGEVRSMAAERSLARELGR